MALGPFTDWEQGLPRRYIEDFVRPFLQSQAGMVLDLGCGTKPYKRLAPRAVAWVGLDMPTGGSIRPDVRANALHLPIRAAAFDCVLATEALEHMSEPAGVIAEIRRVLKPGGRLVLTVPFMAEMHEEPRDYYRFTPYALKKLCADAGLHVEQVATFGTTFSAAVTMALRHSTPLLRVTGPARGFILWGFNSLARAIDGIALRSRKRFDAGALGFGLVAKARTRQTVADVS